MDGASRTSPTACPQSTDIRHSLVYGIATQIVGRERCNAGSFRILPDDVPDHLLGHAYTPCPTSFVNSAEDPATLDVRSFRPPIQHCLHPVRNGDGPGVACLAVQID